MANCKLKVLYDVQKEFSSTLSHELRTPLASIKAAIDIVISGTAGEVTAEQKNFLGRAKSNVDRLNRLINDILDLAHLESGKITLEKQARGHQQDHPISGGNPGIRGPCQGLVFESIPGSACAGAFFRPGQDHPGFK